MGRPRQTRRFTGDIAGSPRERVLALAAFYGAGGILCLVSVAVPGWAGRQTEVILVVGVVAVAVAALLLLTGGSASQRVCYLLVLAGSGLITALVMASRGSGASAAYAGFYVFVAVYSFLFFSPRAATFQVIVGVAGEAAALLGAGQGRVAPAQLVLSLGTIAATGGVVGLLSARLRALGITDSLTGLPNRRAMDLVLTERLAADRARPAVAILGIDLDGFKALNDRQGHAAGDRMLISLAAIWSTQLRHGDILARVGGDEFIVVVSDCDQARAKQVARRLVQVTPPPVSACIGVVIVPPGQRIGDVEISAVLAKVDQALYTGKATGPGTVVAAIWEPDSLETSAGARRGGPFESGSREQEQPEAPSLGSQRSRAAATGLDSGADGT